MAKRILVTGGAGFIGSHLTDLLVSGGHEVAVLDDLSRGRMDYLENSIGKIRFIRGDIRDGKKVKEALDGVETVYHLAAVVGVKYYVDDPLQVLKVNVEGTSSLLEACLDSKVERFVFASTSEVYGKNSRQPFIEDRSERVLGPTGIDRWCYSTSKALDEHSCFAYYRKCGLPVTIIRYFNAYGPRADGSAYGGVVPIFVKQVLSGKRPTVFGTGRQTRCFTYVEDMARATILAAEKERAIGEVFNIGTTQEIAIETLANKIIWACGSKTRPVKVPYVKAYGKHYEDIPRRVPSIAKAKRILGWTPKIKLDEGLKKTIGWYRARV